MGLQTIYNDTTVVGSISANNTISDNAGNSTQWNQAYNVATTYQNASGSLLNLTTTTFTQLTSLKRNNQLVAGQYYRISDFQLMWWNQSINDTTVKFGLLAEPLIVLALSGNRISHEAKSEIYPQDTVYYDVDATSSNSWGTINNNTPIPNFKGWIYRRIDHQLNIDIGWDWRHITVNCCRPDTSSVASYNPATTYNLYSVVKNLANKLYYSIQNSNINNSLTNTVWWLPVSDFVEGTTYFSTDESFGFRAYNKNGIFVNLPANTGTRIQQPTFTSSLVSQESFSLTDCNNIKIEGGYSNVILGNDFRYNTIGNTFYSNTIGNTFYSNTIGNNFYYNNIGNNFYENIIGNDFTSNTIGIDFNSNTIGNNFFYNTIGNVFRYNTIENSFNSNTIGNYFDSNTIGNTFYSNTIGNNFNSNTIGNNFYENIIGNNFNTNTIGDNFDSNTIGNTFSSNVIENNFEFNTIGNNLFSNTIGNLFRFNAIGIGFSLNTIGNLFYSNTIGNELVYNTIGNAFGVNTIGNDFQFNTIGNDFEGNTIGNSFSSNTIGNTFGRQTNSNIIGNNFRMNTSEDNLSIGNVTGATHVYSAYNTRLFKNSNQTVRLSYFNASDQLVVTDPTA